ncbi:hypothetical protein MTO96_014839 [Rhipicephalus appendiculatus]
MGTTDNRALTSPRWRRRGDRPRGRQYAWMDVAPFGFTCAYFFSLSAHLRQPSEFGQDDTDERAAAAERPCSDQPPFLYVYAFARADHHDCLSAEL